MYAHNNYASVRMRTAAYGSVFVCVCVCLSVYYCYNCSTVEMQVKVTGSIGFLPCFLGFTFVDLQNKALFSSYA